MIADVDWEMVNCVATIAAGCLAIVVLIGLACWLEDARTPPNWDESAPEEHDAL